MAKESLYQLTWLNKFGSNLALAKKRTTTNVVEWAKKYVNSVAKSAKQNLALALTQHLSFKNIQLQCVSSKPLGLRTQVPDPTQQRISYAQF